MYSSRSHSNEYFDARVLDATRVRCPPCACPVKNCAAKLEVAPSQWGELPFCPVHGIRIHRSSTKFVYYNGPSASEKRIASARNIRFAKAWFLQNIYGSPLKAESHRFDYETSEDALTWNVCAFLSETANGLSQFAEFLLGYPPPQQNPKLYLWGLRIDLESKDPCQMFASLATSRRVFEPDITRYLTEPDIMLYYPEELLLLCEVKFTSPNKVADDTKAKKGEKPNSLDETLKRYSSGAIPGMINPQGVTQPFYTQLYRNLVFAAHMAKKLNIPWPLTNLVSETQWAQGRDNGRRDPTQQIVRFLTPSYQRRFTFRTWEQYMKKYVVGEKSMKQLDEYLFHKSAALTKAFRIF